MAQRYLRASGNWNGAVWAATSGGAAGSAATPTIADDVYIANNFTVTLTADASCNRVAHTNGTISLASYKLTVSSTSDYDTNFTSSGSTARTIDLGNGTLELTRGTSVLDGHHLSLTGTNLTLNAGNSTVVLNISQAPDMASSTTMETLSKTFNDVIINIGAGQTASYQLNITGSPTFRSFIIQSKNDAAHTVFFEDTSFVYTKKLIVIGSSPSNRLTITAETSGEGQLNIDVSGPDGGTSYGQNVNADIPVDYAGGTALFHPYIGSNSIKQAGTNWILQDPPKVETLVDPLTSTPAANTNFAYQGTAPVQLGIGIGGGGYAIASGGANRLSSLDTYDLTESELIFERPAYDPAGGQFGVDAIGDLVNSVRSVGAWSEILYPDDVAYYSRYDLGGGGTDMGILYPLAQSKFVRIKIEGSTLTVSGSSDGVSWTVGQSQTLNDLELILFKSTRIRGIGGSQAIGSINMLPQPKNTGAFLQFF